MENFRSSSNNIAIRKIVRDMEVTVRIASAGRDSRLDPDSLSFLALSSLEIVREIERCGPAPLTNGAIAEISSVDATKLLETMRARIILKVKDRGEVRYFYVETAPDFCWELPVDVAESLGFTSSKASGWVNQHAADAEEIQPRHQRLSQRLSQRQIQREERLFGKQRKIFVDYVQDEDTWSAQNASGAAWTAEWRDEYRNPLDAM